MPDDDFRFRQQRGQNLRITFVIEDRCFRRELHLCENARRDGGSKVTEKQGFHVLPQKAELSALPSPLAKGMEAALRNYQEIAGYDCAARSRSNSSGAKEDIGGAQPNTDLPP